MGLFRNSTVSDVGNESGKLAKSAHLGEFAGLPSAFKNPGKELLSKDAYQIKLEDLIRFPVRQAQEAAQFLTQLCRFNIKPEKRVQLVRGIIGTVYPAMSRYYQQYQSKVMSLPESNERRQMVMACIEIADQTATAYKHLFKALYSAKPMQYRRQREKLVETAIRILEMQRVAQRFRALRHQKMPASDWQDCNRVFFSMWVHKDISDRHVLFGTIGSWARTQGHGAHAQLEYSIRDLYLSIQLFGLIDAPSWSTRLFHAPDAYLEHISDAVQLVKDSGEELQPGWLITHIDHRAPPVFSRGTHMAEPRVCIEYSHLYNRLIVDYEELAKMKFINKYDSSRLSRPLLSLEMMERLPFLESMLFGLRPRERKQKRHAVFKRDNVRVYFGYRETYRLLSDLADHDVKRVMASRAFVDTLASHSSNIDSDTVRSTNWDIVNFSTGGILIQTGESNYTVPIQIGQIVGFIPNNETRRPLLGYVSRINRPSDQQIEVAIVRLASYTEIGIVQDNAQKDAFVGKGVIVFRNLDNRWCLIARHEYNFISGTPLRLTRENNQRLPARLGNVLLTKQEFVIFELSAPGL